MKTMSKKIFKDYPKSKIIAKLREVQIYEKTYGENETSKAIKKWCTDPVYRKKEWLFRQSVAASIKPNVNYLKDYYEL
jgi:hypothetical protein